jgi:ribose transport system substrate-binding protein
MAFGRGGQQAGGGSESKITIGRVVFDMSHPYQQADNAFSQARAKELGVNYIYLDGKSDVEAQANGVSDLISRKVSGIIVQPLDGAAIQPSLDEAIKAGIPIITFYQQSVKKNVPTLVINQADSATELGARAAKKWIEWYPNKPIKVALIYEPDSAIGVENRARPFIAGVMSVAPNAEVVAMLDGKGVRDAAMAAGDDLLQSHPEANIIYGTNADSALGCLAAYEAGGRGKAARGIPLTELIVGTDGTEPELIKLFDPASSYKMTMALSAKNNGIGLVDTVMKVINGEIPRVGEYIVTTQNKVIDYYSMTLEDGQAYLKDEVGSKTDLKSEIGL